MNVKTYLPNRLTPDEEDKFFSDGYLVVKKVLSQTKIRLLNSAVDSLPSQGGYDRNFILENQAFIDLLTYPETFSKIIDLLGWNIYCYHNHLAVNPTSHGNPPKKEIYGWHKDGGQINWDIPIGIKPLSIKVGFFLTDLPKPNMGNFMVIPKSQLDKIPDEGRSIALCVEKGDAVFFDNRVWHSPSLNFSDVTRKVLFYGYAYRWQRPQDEVPKEFIEKIEDPITKQLLGYYTDGKGCYQPAPKEVPLKKFLNENN